MPNVNVKKIKSAPKSLYSHQLLGWIIIAIFLVLALSFFIAGKNHDYLQFGNKTLTIEKASTPNSREKGLSGRQNISETYGMLFIFQKPDKHCFWMKDMKFPIDMLWLDETRKVIHIAAHVPPESYPASFCPPENAKYVLEVQAGLSQRASVDVGTQL